MNHRRLFFSLPHGMARRSFRTFLGLSAMTIALTVLTDASADPKPGAKDGKDAKGQHEARKGLPGAPGDKDKAGPKGEHGRGGPEGKADREHGMHPHEQGAAGAPGHWGHGQDLKAIGQRLKELTEKEAAGKLTADEKAELARLKHHPGRHFGILRKGLLAELEAKEKAGKLTDDEKAELEKVRKIESKHEAMKKAFEKKAADRKERVRDAKRKALSEFPQLSENALAVAEYKKHAERLAKLERAKDLAEADENSEMTQKIDKLISAEKQRHQAWLSKNQSKAQGAAQ